VYTKEKKSHCGKVHNRMKPSGTSIKGRDHWRRESGGKKDMDGGSIASSIYNFLQKK